MRLHDIVHPLEELRLSRHKKKSLTEVGTAERIKPDVHTLPGRVSQRAAWGGGGGGLSSLSLL